MERMCFRYVKNFLWLPFKTIPIYIFVSNSK